MLTDKENEPILPLQRGQVWRRAIIMALLCAALAALATSDALHAALLELLAVSEQLITHHPVTGAVLFVGFAALSAMLAFVSVAVIVPLAVYTWGEPLSILLLWSGWLLGGLCAYATGRYLGRPIVVWLTANAGLRQLERYLRHDASFALVLLFQLALPSEIPGYVLGLVSYSLPRYLLSLALAELPYALATIHLGASFVERRSALVLGLGLSLMILSIAAFTLLRKQLVRQEPEQP
ncbi:MAG: VTT domain-containing protein [Steroidobacteraceae bacterium]